MAVEQLGTEVSVVRPCVVALVVRDSSIVGAGAGE